LKRVTKSEFLLRLDEMLELEPGTLTGTELLTELPRWDSLAIIGYIALLDEHFGVSVPASKINGCQSLAELLALVGPELS
jgi:acyl carrier protein